MHHDIMIPTQVTSGISTTCRKLAIQDHPHFASPQLCPTVQPSRHDSRHQLRHLRRWLVTLALCFFNKGSKYARAWMPRDRGATVAGFGARISSHPSGSQKTTSMESLKISHSQVAENGKSIMIPDMWSRKGRLRRVCAVSEVRLLWELK